MRILSSLLLVLLPLSLVRAALDLAHIAPDEGLLLSLSYSLRAFGEAGAALGAAIAPSLAAILLARALGRAIVPLPGLAAAGVLALAGIEIALRTQPVNGAPREGILLWSALAWLVVIPLVALLASRLSAPIMPPSSSGRAAAVATLASLAVVGITTALPIIGSALDERALRARRAQAGAAPNVVLIVLDTVRADHLSCYGLPRDPTPEMDRLARQGVQYTHATSPAPWTLPAHASLFTGLYPSEHGASSQHLHLDDEVITLAEALDEVGYRTVGFSKKEWLSRRMGTLQGFQRYGDLRLDGVAKRLLWARLAALRPRPERAAEMRTAGPDPGGDAIASAASDWLVERRRAFDDLPFFLFLNFNEAHLPYLPPRREFLRYARKMPSKKAVRVNMDPARFVTRTLRLPAEELGVLDDLYTGEIATCDRLVGRVVASLDEIGELDNTVVIVTADHGDNIGEHDLMGHVLCVYETLLHVPLIIRYPPRVPAGKLDTRPAELGDVYPTVMELVGHADFPALAGLSGRSLLVDSTRAFAYAEYPIPSPTLELYEARFPDFDLEPYRRGSTVLWSDGIKLIEGTKGRHELFDLRADPGERVNLAERQPERLAEIMERLDSYRGALRRLDSLGDVEIDAATREELRALGYIN